MAKPRNPEQIRAWPAWPAAWSLQWIFVLCATAIVVIAMSVLGSLVANEFTASITQGIAETAATSLDVLLAGELAEAGKRRPLDVAARQDLDKLFSAVNNARLNKLLEIQLRNPDASLLYASASDLVDDSSITSDVAAALAGTITARLVDLPLSPLGPVASARLPTLKVVSPVHDLDTGAVIATAELYFGARNLVDLQQVAERQVWITVGVIGAGAIAVLFVLVNRTDRVIAGQRRELATSLAASQALASENVELRQQASIANESLLAQVGSDLHDGPLQLLALVILKLTTPRRRPTGDAAATIAQRAMDELRGISAGLVLPELSELTLEATIRHCIRRHEDVTGSSVAAHIDAQLPEASSPDLRLCVYRVLQEGLANTHRHGFPGSAVVTVRRADNQLVLEISNGLPEVPHPVAEGTRYQLGLQGIRTRLHAIGGTMIFDTSADTARLALRVPLPEPGDKL